MTALTAWQNFYVIVGSAAGALIGLQFVVLSLIANRPGVQANADAGNAFATPTVVHFGTVLGLSAMINAPWNGIVPPIVIWELAGLGGSVYGIMTIRRMRSQTAYHPEFEDWLFYGVLPLAAYLTLAVSGFVAQFHFGEALFGIAAAVLLLLFIGIQNAWDAVTYHVFMPRRHDHQ